MGDEPARDPWFTVRLTPSVLRHLSGDDLTVPNLRAPIDLAIAERAAALFPPLGHPGGWAARFGRELNATEDRDQLKPIGCGGLPVIAGKSIEPFRVKLAEAHRAISVHNAHRMLGTRHDRPRLAYRDVASAKNRLTLIAAILSPRCVSTHTLFCLRTPLTSRAQHFLCGLFNSFLVNYLVRQRVATHVTTAIVERLPMPRREQAPGAFEGDCGRRAPAWAAEAGRFRRDHERTRTAECSRRPPLPAQRGRIRARAFHVSPRAKAGARCSAAGVSVTLVGPTFRSGATAIAAAARLEDTASAPSNPLGRSSSRRRRRPNPR